GCTPRTFRDRQRSPSVSDLGDALPTARSPSRTTSETTTGRSCEMALRPLGGPVVLGSRYRAPVTPESSTEHQSPRAHAGAQAFRCSPTVVKEVIRQLHVVPLRLALRQGRDFIRQRL